MIVLLYNGKEERIECRNYISIGFLSLVGKICAGILVDRARKVTGGLIDDETKRMYFNSLVCVRVNVGESKCCRIGSGVAQGSIISP